MHHHTGFALKLLSIVLTIVAINGIFYFTKQVILNNRLRSVHKPNTIGIGLVVITCPAISWIIANICAYPNGDSYAIALFIMTTAASYVGAYMGYAEDAKLTPEEKANKLERKDTEELNRMIKGN